MRLPVFPAYATPLDKAGWWALRVFGVAMLAFLLLPILVIVPLSFSASSFLSYPMPGWSLQWYENLFTSPDWIRAAKNSFIVAPAATLIATVLGTLTAVGLARVQFPGKGLLMSVLIAPMVVPIVVDEAARVSAEGFAERFDPSACCHRGEQDRIPRTLVDPLQRLELRRIDEVDFVEADDRFDPVALGGGQEAIQEPAVERRVSHGGDYHEPIQVGDDYVPRPEPGACDLAWRG